MTPITSRSERTLLALSLTCFAVAGVANTTVGANGRTTVAIAVAVAGVYGLAGYARSVGRPRLARLSLTLWLAFLAVAGVHLGAGTGTAVAGGLSTGGLEIALSVATWSTLLGAASATAFLAFREYGASTGVETPDEQFLEL